MPRKSKAALERDRFQVKIKTQYPGLVKKYTLELCTQGCSHWLGGCMSNLLPVTSEGKRCPYFGKEVTKI